MVVLILLFFTFDQISEIFLRRWLTDLVVETLKLTIVIFDKNFVNLIALKLFESREKLDRIIRIWFVILD